MFREKINSPVNPPDIPEGVASRQFCQQSHFTFPPVKESRRSLLHDPDALFSGEKFHTVEFNIRTRAAQHFL